MNIEKYLVDKKIRLEDFPTRCEENVGKYSKTG